MPTTELGQTGDLAEIQINLANVLRKKDHLDVSPSYTDATFANKRGGTLKIGNTNTKKKASRLYLLWLVRICDCLSVRVQQGIMKPNLRTCILIFGHD